MKRLTKGIQNFKNKCLSIFKKEEGQGLIEYVMIIVLILIVGIGGLVLFRDQVMAVIQNVTNGIMTR